MTTAVAGHRRRRRLLGLALAVAALAAACGDGAATTTGASAGPTASGEPAAPSAPADAPPLSSSSERGSPAPDATASTGDARVTTAAAPSCAMIRRPTVQAGSHLIGDQEPPVPYSSTPPTSGWHASGHLHVDVRGSRDPLTEPEQVSVLEAGGVVVAHGALDPAERRRLADRVRRRHDGVVAVTPYDALPDGVVAFTSWGVLQRCDGVGLAALERFVDRFGPDAAVKPGH